MADPQVSIRVSVDQSEVADGLRRLESGFQRSFTEINSAIMLAQQAFSAASGAIDTFADVISDAVLAAGEQEQVERRVVAAMQQRGDFTQEAWEALNNFNVSIQQNLGLGDEQLLQLQGTLSALGIQSDKLGEATKATIGLSEATGQDLASAGRIVARVLQGNTSALTRYGFEVNNAAEAQEVFNNLFEVAEAQAGTLEQGLSTLSANVGDLQQAFGGAIRESAGFESVLREVNAIVLDLTEAMGGEEAQAAISGFFVEMRLAAVDAVSALQGLIVALDGVIQVVTDIADAIQFVDDLADDFNNLTREIAGTQQGVRDLVDSITGIPLVGPLKGVVEGVVELGEESGETGASFSSAGDEIVMALERVKSAIGDTRRELGDLDATGFAQDVLISISAQVEGGQQALQDSLANAQKQIDAANRNRIKALRERQAQERELERQRAEEQRAVAKLEMEIIADQNQFDAIMAGQKTMRLKAQAELEIELAEDQLEFDRIIADQQRELAEEQAFRHAFITSSVASNLNFMQGVISDLIKNGTETLKDLEAVALGAVGVIKEAIAGTIVSAANAFGEGEDALKAIGGFLGGVLKQIGTMLVQLGTAGVLAGTLGTFIPALAGLTGGPLGVAAGTAAIAGGAAIIAAGAALAGGSGGGGGRSGGSRGGGAVGGVRPGRADGGFFSSRRDIAPEGFVGRGDTGGDTSPRIFNITIGRVFGDDARAGRQIQRAVSRAAELAGS